LLRAQGNLLLDINVLPSTDTTLLPTSASSSSFSNGNPTQHLISLLASSTSPSLANAAVGKAWLGGKEKSFFLGFLGEEGKVDRIVKIMSGDPKRGGMALDSEKSFPEGSKFVVSISLSLSFLLLLASLSCRRIFFKKAS